MSRQSNLVIPEPYVIELCGGCFDGYREPSQYVPLEDRLEMPVASPLEPESSAPRAAVYHRGQPALILLDGFPTLVVRYDFASIHASKPPAAPGILARWARRLRRCMLG